MNDLIKHWSKIANDLLCGLTVKKAYYCKQTSIDLGWDEMGHDACLVIEFTNGTIIIPSRDDEGNGAGAIFTNIEGSDCSLDIKVLPTL